MWGDTCRRGGGGGRLGDGVKPAPGLGREEGFTVPTPPRPRTRDALEAGVCGLIDEEEADEDGGLPELLLLMKNQCHITCLGNTLSFILIEACF